MIYAPIIRIARIRTPSTAPRPIAASLLVELELLEEGTADVDVAATAEEVGETCVDVAATVEVGETYVGVAVRRATVDCSRASGAGASKVSVVWMEQLMAPVESVPQQAEDC
jgi:hypothetical protein